MKHGRWLVAALLLVIAVGIAQSRPSPAPDPTAEELALKRIRAMHKACWAEYGAGTTMDWRGFPTYERQREAFLAMISDATYHERDRLFGMFTICRDVEARWRLFDHHNELDFDTLRTRCREDASFDLAACSAQLSLDVTCCMNERCDLDVCSGVCAWACPEQLPEAASTAPPPAPDESVPERTEATP